MKKIIVFAAMIMVLFSGCSDDVSSPVSSVSQAQIDTQTGYEQITQEEAQRIMDTEDNIVILDVRTQQEFDEGHIPGAICLPNESINGEDIDELPDKEQIILVYCRSGRRSKEASKKLASYGYTNILEFGGIIDWQGDIEK